MLIYLYDGTFEGLLTAIYQGYYSTPKPQRIELPDNRQQQLMEETRWIESDAALAAKVSQAIVQKLSQDILEKMMYVWMSEESDGATVVWHFIRYAFKAGAVCINNEAHPLINPVLKYARATQRESHRMLGLVRFMQLESGLYYSCIEPEHNILMILAAHFAQRLGDQSWVLHDARRKLAAFYNQETWHIAPVPEPQNLELHAEEKAMQEWWKGYFEHIAIKERINPKLQRQMMPKKYWKYLVEKNGAIR